MTLKLALVPAAALAAAFAITPAAAIQCAGGYQIVNGSPISTPYCADNQVGEVARSYGIRVTNDQIRNNPNIKRDVCRTVGRDNRVYLACLQSNPNGRRF